MNRKYNKDKNGGASTQNYQRQQQSLVPLGEVGYINHTTPFSSLKKIKVKKNVSRMASSENLFSTEKSIFCKVMDGKKNAK